MKGVSETVENEIQEQKGGFLGVLAATLSASLLSNVIGNMLAGKGVKDIIPENEVAILVIIVIIRAGEGTIRASEGKVRADQNF